MDVRTWVPMGVNGVSWVWRGVGARIHSKTRLAEEKIDKQDMFSGPMAGEISPNVMFFLD